MDDHEDDLFPNVSEPTQSIESIASAGGEPTGAMEPLDPDIVPPNRPTASAAPGEPIGVVRPLAAHEQPQAYRGTPLWRRLVALGGLGSVAVITGLLIALAVAAAMAGAAILLQRMIG